MTQMFNITLQIQTKSDMILSLVSSLFNIFRNGL